MNCHVGLVVMVVVVSVPLVSFATTLAATTDSLLFRRAHHSPTRPIPTLPHRPYPPVSQVTPLA